MSRPSKSVILKLMRNRTELITNRIAINRHLVQRKPNMMMSKVILLCGQDDVLSSYVENILTTQKGWHVVRIAFEQDYAALNKIVEKVKPMIVILELGKRSSSFNLPVNLLRDHPELKVLTLSLGDNLMEVYSKQNILIETADDLISAIEVNPVSLINNINAEESQNLESGDENEY